MTVFTRMRKNYYALIETNKTTTWKIFLAKLHCICFNRRTHTTANDTAFYQLSEQTVGTDIMVSGTTSIKQIIWRTL